MNFLSSIYFMIFLHQFRSVLIVMGKETCSMAKFVCYQCDSRVDDYCGDPFKVNRANRTVECADYCVKFYHFDETFRNETFIRRGCLTDYFLNRLSKIDVCYRHTTGSNFTMGRFCMCAKEMCNGTSHNSFPFSLLVFQIFVFMYLKRIFS